MLFTQKIQLNLTEEQEKLLDSQSKICNWLYNRFLEIEQTAYKMSGNYLGYFNHNQQFSAFKNEHPFLKVVHSQVLKETLRRLHKALVILGLTYYALLMTILKRQAKSFLMTTKQGAKPVAPNSAVGSANG